MTPGIERPDSSLDPFRALHEVAVAGAGLRDPIAVAKLAVEHAQRLVGVDGAAVFAFDARAALLVPLGESLSSIPEGPCRPGEGAVGIAFEGARTVVVDDYPAFGDAMESSIRRGLASCVAVPLVAEGRPIGVLGVWTYRRRVFSGADLQLLSLLAAQVAPALEAADLIQERERQAGVFQALHEVALAASGVLDPAALGALIASRVGDLLHLDGVAAFWLEGPAGRLRLFAHQGRADFGDGTVEPGVGMVGACFAERRPLVLEDYPGWRGALESGAGLGVASAAAVPLVAHDRSVGVLLVWNLSRHAFPHSEVELLILLAAQMAPALEAARLVEDRESHTRGMRVLNQVAVAASGVLEPAALAALAVEKAQELAAADGATLVWFDEEAGLLRVLADSHPAAPATPELSPGEGVLGAAFRDRRPVVVEDHASWPGALGRAPELGDRSVVAVPLLVRDRPVGALAVHSRVRRAFGADEVQLLALLASVVAPALQAARLHSDLVASEQRFRSLYETIACGVVVQGPGGEVLHANLAAEDILGVTLNEMRDAPDGELWTAADEEGRPLPAAERPPIRAVRTGRPVRGVGMLLTRPGGYRRWLQVDSVPLMGADGRPVQVVSSFIDVTQRRQTEEALRESEGRFRAVFDHSAMGILRMTPDGIVVEANPAFHRMLGYSPGELAGMPFSDLVIAESVDLHRLAELAEGRREQSQVEVRFRRRDGELVWGNTLASLVSDDRREPLFLIAMVEDVSDRKAQEAALEHQALHDALTDLPNRTLLTDRLRQALLAAQREGSAVAFMIMDLDRFKEVNDSFGHQLGDLLLQQVAARLRGQLRESDTVARLGGDEFAMILPGVDEEAAAELAAKKVIKTLEDPFLLDTEVLHIGGSVGIALHPQHGADVETLMRRADIAMYAAKRGGSGFAVYSSEGDTGNPSRLLLLGELRQAVPRNELVLHYQPKIDIRTGRTVGLEALVRWSHPRHGLLLPEQFLGLAEDTGIINSLGLWVVEAALEQCGRWSRVGIDLPVSVNLSSRSLRDAQLPETVAWLLAAHQVPAERLRVEVTESTLMAGPERAMEVLSSLAEMGLGITIDDFGTGYSSLAYIGRLPADELKIARPLVGEMATLENAQVIVRSIIDLGHSLGLMVVGEGVESRYALGQLAAGACDLAQGFVISRPLPAAEVPDWLATPAPAVRESI